MFSHCFIIIEYISMILPDVNILIHAVNTESHLNKHISRWWDDCLLGATPVYLPCVVILGVKWKQP